MNTGRVDVHSGLDGSVRYGVLGRDLADNYGFRVCGLGDVDGDGMRDFLAGTYRRRYPGGGFTWLPNCGATEVRSGRDGSLIHEVSPMVPSLYFSIGLSALGDVDGDGIEDYVSSTYAGGPGSARVVSGASGSFLYIVPAPTGSGGFGVQIESVGDLDGDGVQDFGVVSLGEAGGALASVRTYSGVDGSLLHEFANVGSTGARSLAALGDLDGDGVPDFAIQCAAGDTFPLRVVSGRDSSFLYRIHLPSLSSGTVSLGDVTGDGAGDFAVSIPGLTYGEGQGSGLVVIYRAGPCDVHPVCTSSPNSVGPGVFMNWQGSTSLAANDFRVEAHGAPPHAVGRFVIGDAAVDQPFGAGRLCVLSEGGKPRALGGWGIADAQGFASIGVDLEVQGVLALRPAIFQYLYRDNGSVPPSFNASDALELVACP